MSLSLAMVNYNSLKIFENLHTFQILRTFLIFASLRTICSRGDCAFLKALLEKIGHAVVNFA